MGDPGLKQPWITQGLVQNVQGWFRRSSEAFEHPNNSSPTVDHNLSVPAHSALSLEPILFPKLRIYFADFPYLHCSIGLEAVDLGDLMRLSVRPGLVIIITHAFSRIVNRTPDTPKWRCFPTVFGPISN
jgi:hypothetical protein